ncbi:MAG TPA: serine hydrolase, partial [Gemmatimonadaceae bacterium]
MHLAIGEVFEGAEGRFGGDTKIAQGAGLADRAANVVLAIPLQRDLGRTLARLGPVEAKVSKLEALATWIDGNDPRTSGWTGLFKEKRHGLPRPKLEPGASSRPLVTRANYGERNSGTLVTWVTRSHIRVMLWMPLALVASLLLPPLQGGQTTPAHVSLDSLRASIGKRVAEVENAVVGIALRDYETGDTLFINADDSFHAASTMKVPVMIELYRRVDAGGFRLDQGIPLVNQFASIVDGSPYSLNAGDDSDSSAYGLIGKRVPLRELIERMITRSSNLATNALIELVGAKNANATAHTLGATNIRVLRGVEDGKAFQAGLNNSTTARDLAALLDAIETGR